MSEEDKDMSEEDKENEFLVPGRVSLDTLHREKQELKEAKHASRMEPKSRKVINAMSMFSIATDLGLIIALPLIILTYLGKWMDARYGTKYFVLIGLALAIAISALGIYKQIKKLKDHISKK